MNAKKWTAMLCAAALAVSLAACGTRTAETADAGSTLTGQVSAVDGSEVTLLLGTLEESEAGTAPGSTSGQNSQTGVPPEKPEGSSDSGSAPGSPNVQSSAKPDGDSNGGTPPDMPSRGAPDGQSSGSVPSGDSLSRPGGSFTAGTESITLNFADAVITENGRSADLDDIEAGVVLTVVVGAGNTAVSADIVSLAGGMGTPGGFGGSSEVTQGSSANTISEDGSYANVSCFSSGDDENALRVDGADVTLDQITVNKSAGADSNDLCDLGLFLCGCRKDYSAFCGFFCFDRLNNNTVSKRFDFHDIHSSDPECLALICSECQLTIMIILISAAEIKYFFLCLQFFYISIKK